MKKRTRILRKRNTKSEIKLQKLQKGPTLTPSMSTIGIRPKQFVDQHGYCIMKQGKAKGTYDHDRYIGPYSTNEQQIRTDAMLLGQIYEEEQKQFKEQIKQVGNKRSNENDLNQMKIR